MKNIKSDTLLTDEFKHATDTLNIEEINTFRVNSRDGLLSAAVDARNMALVKFLVEERSTNINHSNNTCPLVYAVFDLKIFKYLIGKGANVNCSNSKTLTTPLISAVKKSNTIELLRGFQYKQKQNQDIQIIIKLLLKNGADIDAKDYCNKTAFDYARGNSGILAILIRYKYYRCILAKTIIMSLLI